jgi:hypothetical protein
MSASTVHYPSKIRLRVTAGLREALQRAARQNHTTSSEWMRQTLLRGLSIEGIEVEVQRDGGSSPHTP